MALETRLRHAPGEKYLYSNVGYSMLAAVIEIVTEQSYESYLWDALFLPAGMMHTGYLLPDWSDAEIAVGYARGQALTNLIKNGVRHTPTGGQVTVNVAHTKEQVFISVADNDPGIPAADLPNVFERFWRGDKSRSRHSGGSGLGLSIVRQIADLHSGSVQVVSPDSGGAQFTITLPLAG